MKYCWYILLISLMASPLPAQFLGGAGDGVALVGIANPDLCPYFWGDSTSGASRTTLANPDSCGFFEGNLADGFSMFNLANPDSCGFYEGNLADGFAMFNLANPDSCGVFEGTNDDGFAMGYMASPVPCPTFYGSSRAGFSMGYLFCTPLEVTATPLKGRMEGSNAYLWWHTFTEVNNLGFILYRSEDRFNWTEVAWMDGSGSTNAIRKYEHTDEEKPLGVSYYRWQQLDFDGSTTFSNTVALLKSAEEGKGELTLFPVPLHRGELLNLHFYSSATNPVRLTIVDLYGKVLLKEEVAKTGEKLFLNFDAQGWSAGSYFLILDQGNHRYSKRFIVL